MEDNRKSMFPSMVRKYANAVLDKRLDVPPSARPVFFVSINSNSEFYVCVNEYICKYSNIYGIDLNMKRM